MRAPDFWEKDGFLGRALAPLGALYARAGRFRRRSAKPERLPVPVICIGNVTSGGTGKTPTALKVADMLAAEGQKPWFLTRGYGGRMIGPVIVDPAVHGPEQVGDEALLLAAVCPTVVARDRVAGGRLAIASGATVLVMDDGFQNPYLAKDLSILVFDGGAGIGNGRVIPAGPLRESLAEGVARADLAVIIGEDLTGLRQQLADRLPILSGLLVPNAEDAATLRGKRALAFAGIGRPRKFFETLQAVGVDLSSAVSFADHQVLRTADLADLRAKAARQQAMLVTTAKDFARLPPAQRHDIAVLRVALEIEDPAPLLDALRRLR
jgi:tetraacyldisaccharide 4'-kinase